MKLPFKFALIWNFTLEYSSGPVLTESRPVLKAGPNHIKEEPYV